MQALVGAIRNLLVCLTQVIASYDLRYYQKSGTQARASQHFCLAEL